MDNTISIFFPNFIFSRKKANNIGIKEYEKYHLRVRIDNTSSINEIKKDVINAKEAKPNPLIAFLSLKKEKATKNTNKIISKYITINGKYLGVDRNKANND